MNYMIKEVYILEFISFFEYNSIVVLSFFFLSFLILIINGLTKGKINKMLFSSYRSSLVNPLTYVRLFTHILGHQNRRHFTNNFLYILLIGPMIEEKYGSINLLIMILVTAFITGIINSIVSKNRILGSSGIVFMMIVLSSLVNLTTDKIPLTLIIICLFYVVNEVVDCFTKRDNISHLGHLIGALSGFIFGFYIF